MKSIICSWDKKIVEVIYDICMKLKFVGWNKNFLYEMLYEIKICWIVVWNNNIVYMLYVVNVGKNNLKSNLCLNYVGTYNKFMVYLYAKLVDLYLVL